MPDHEPELSGLVALWDLGTGRDPEAQELDDEELLAMFREWLNAPLPLSSAVADAVPTVLGRPCPDLADLGLKTFQEVLLSHETDVGTFCVIRDYFKKLSRRVRDKGSCAVMVALYFAVIAEAQVHHQRKITSHAWHYLEKTYTHYLSCKWTPKTIRALFTEMLKVCRKQISGL